MTLKDYLRTGAKSAVELAKLTGLSGASISRLAAGSQSPTLATMEALALATEGAVMPNDWLDASAITRGGDGQNDVALVTAVSDPGSADVGDDGKTDAPLSSGSSGDVSPQAEAAE
jgi:transcriptional regulator with XRE-family HTH domain